MKRVPVLCLCMVMSASAGASYHDPIGFGATDAPVSARPGQTDTEAMYGYLKGMGEAIPEWMTNELFPIRDEDNPDRNGGDTYATATVIPFVSGGTYSDAGNTNNATNNYDYVAIPATCNTSYFTQSFNGRDVVYTFTLPASCTVTASTCGAATYDSCLGIVASNGTLLAVNDDGQNCINYTSRIPACCLPAGTYYLVVDGYDTSSGAFTLTVTFGATPCIEVNPCDTFNEDITNITLPFTGTGSTVDAPDILGSDAGDVGYAFSLTESSSVRFNSCMPGTTFDVDSYLFQGSPCSGGTQLLYNDGLISCDTWEFASSWSLDCGVLGAGDYILVLSGYLEYEGEYEFALSAWPCFCPPVECVGEAEQEPNDTSIAGGSFNEAGTRCGMITPGDQDWYRVELTGDASISAELETGLFNGVLALYDDQGHVLMEANAVDWCGSEMINDGCREADIYYLQVRGSTAAVEGDYSLTLLLETCTFINPYLACQTTFGPDEAYHFYTSEQDRTGFPITCRERFHIDRPIQALTFEGTNAVYANGNWSICNENPMPFTIRFYNAFLEMVHEYQTVLTAESTGVIYGGYIPLLRYRFLFPEPLALDDGWLEIQGAGSPDCWFLWATANGADGYALYYINGVPYENIPDLNFCLEPVEDVVAANETPMAFCLNALAPNPFNPTTTITFSLPETQPARLLIHDLIGRQVAILADGLMARGEHKVVFDGSGLASGIYLCTLDAEAGVQTRKLVLAK